MFAFKTLRQEPTALSEAFFGDDNVNEIHQHIIERVYTETGLNLSRQSDDDLGIVMRHFFAEYGEMPGRVREQVLFLNSKVVDAVVPDIIASAKQHLKFMNTFEKPLVPIPRGLNASVKGVDGIQLQ